MKKRSLVILTKAPVAGEVKTRLIGHLSASQALDLHAAMLEDLTANLEGGAFEVSIAWAVAGTDALPAAWPQPGLRFTLQTGSDLGARIFNALSDAAAEAVRVAVVGSDHPGLGRRQVEQAFEVLESTAAGVAIGPAADGGYYLLAISAASLSQRLFAGVEWSTDRVLAQTLERCRELGLAVHLLAEGTDVDTAHDLDRVARALRSGDLHAPRLQALLGQWEEQHGGEARA